MFIITPLKDHLNDRPNVYVANIDIGQVNANIPVNMGNITSFTDNKVNVDNICGICVYRAGGTSNWDFGFTLYIDGNGNLTYNTTTTQSGFGIVVGFFYL